MFSLALRVFLIDPCQGQSKKTSKYKSEVFNNFCQILNQLDRKHNTALSKEKLIELVKLVYLINPEGKGKQRKRTLEETLNILNSSN